ncbi:MAG: hypothetical protein JKY09_01875, partial [Crocinitomicaceae bacterium]|nr:hypothetical protein [Crocinitomicaceae bacterium]
MKTLNSGLKIDYFCSMKKVALSLALLLTLTTYSQEVIPFVDFNGYFKSFQNGFFRQVEFQRIKEFKFGDDVVAYIDYKNNLRVFDGTSPKDLTNVPSEYRVSDHLLTWKIASTLNMWDAGELRTLTSNVGNYQVKDSLIVYQDTRFNSVHVYYNGAVYELYASVGGSTMPDFIGENIIAFRDNGNFFKVFWQGEIYDLDVWHRAIAFEGGTDMLVFNDPINGTFAIFEGGQFLDVEMFHMGSYKAGRSFMVYENLNGDLIHYGSGEKTPLTDFGASFWDVRDDVVIWGENGYTYAFVDGKKMEIARYIP